MRHAATMRFGLMSLAGTPEDVIADARLAADAGFDVIATADHLRHPRDPQVPGLDGWSILAAWAVTTERLRLAMLVSNLIYRHPVVLAKQVITVDQLSGGRVDVGVGAGVYPTDHSMAGVANWTPRERVDRLDEFVRALAAALDGDESFDGRFYSFSNASWAPGPRQLPRPPLAVGAVGPRLLRVTARHADVWSAFGGLALDNKAACFAALGEQARVIDSECEAIDREPSTLRRSLLAFRPLAPWTSAGALDEIVEFARELRFDEVVVYKPTTDEELDVFEDAVARLPSLRAG
jgi:alkanesulfonate monooxygenase SsuD/methylene tetrahydromethanopterin reductase-like flavin-dependent oxidoreductase (luciferase family)